MLFLIQLLKFKKEKMKFGRFCNISNRAIEPHTIVLKLIFEESKVSDFINSENWNFKS